MVDIERLRDIFTPIFQKIPKNDCATYQKSLKKNRLVDFKEPILSIILSFFNTEDISEFLCAYRAVNTNRKIQQYLQATQMDYLRTYLL